MSVRKSVFGPERVQLDLSRDEWASLLYVLGYAAGAFLPDKTERLAAIACLRITNTINEGNPGWIPFEVDKL